MAQLETAIEPSDVKPILEEALRPMKDRALSNLASVVKTGSSLRLPDQKHIEDVLFTDEGKSSTRATAFLKLWRKFAPQGVWIEFGHVLWRGGVRRKGQGHQIGEVNRRPFFRPAVDVERKPTEARIEAGIKKLIGRFTSNYTA
jgi:hypothetical protein